MVRIATLPQAGISAVASLRWLLGLALQNIGRHKARTLSLLSAVAIASAAVFTSAVLTRSIQTSIEVGFSRLGADLLVLPDGALNNLTAALLTVEPSDLTLDMSAADRVLTLRGVKQVAPQLIIRTDASGYGTAREVVDLVAFDPIRDLTVQPWVSERLNRPFRKGDIIVGGRRQEQLGSEVLIFGRPLVVYGKLARTAVGTHERGLFMSFDSLRDLQETMRAICGPKATLEDNAISGLLVELRPEATEQQVRFAVLANLAGVKVVAGASTLSSIRQGLVALVHSVVMLVVLMLASTAIMAGVLFAALIAERRGELGLLKAIGAKQRQIVGLLLIEVGLVTSAGGAAGCLLGGLALRFFRHSLVYQLTSMGIPFVWLDGRNTIVIGLACVLSAALIGALGALRPAWRASGREPYDLIRGDV